MDRILLPVTSQPTWASDVAAVARDIESPAETEAIVIHVFTGDEIESTRENLNLRPDEDASLDYLAARKAGVSATVKDLARVGMSTRIKGVLAEGEPGSAIIASAEEEDVDRIYLYSRRRSPAGKAMFGSTVQRVLLNADVPVIVLPAPTV